MAQKIDDLGSANGQTLQRNDGVRRRACEWMSLVEKAALPLHEELVLPAGQIQV